MDTITKVWLSAHQPVTQEVQLDLPISEGELPVDLCGVLYRNGAGRFGIGDQLYGHLFDGDGMVLRFAMGATSADSRPRIRYRNCYVRTREFVAEERAGRILYRGFGTNLPGGVLSNCLRTRTKNAANSNIVYHAGRLLALWGGGLPHLLDPVTLDTLGRYDFDGGLENHGPWISRMTAPKLTFAAHPKHDLESGDLFNFGLCTGGEPRLLVYRVDSRGRLSTLREIALPSLAFLHDFVVTRHFFVFFICPMEFEKSRIISGLSTIADALQPLSLSDAPTRILLLPRDGSAPRWCDTAPCFIFHFANAFEDDEGRVVVDALRERDYSEFPTIAGARAGRMGNFPRAILTRFTIDPRASSGASVPPVKEEPLSDCASEYPSVNPSYAGRPHRYVFATGPSPGAGMRHHNIHTAILRHDTHQRTTLCRDFFDEQAPCLPSEPIMVPRASAADESDGYLLTVVYQGFGESGSDGAREPALPRRHRSALYILDARDLSTVCVAQLPHHVPPSFHGCFVPGAACPPGWYA